MLLFNCSLTEFVWYSPNTKLKFDVAIKQFPNIFQLLTEAFRGRLC